MYDGEVQLIRTIEGIMAFNSIISSVLSLILPHIRNDTSKDEYMKSLDEFLTNLPSPDFPTHNPYSKLALSVSNIFFEFIDSLEWDKTSIIGRFCAWNDSIKNNEKIKQTVEILQLVKRVFEITYDVGDKNKEMIDEVNE
ncbi:11134_t:CDS:2 [Entrophospora sp. SA101]|nr:11134_t:CDS:2 [Entrophospora sp. SA101]